MTDAATERTSSATDGGGLGVTALVCGLCGIPFAILWPLGLVIGAIAIVFGVIARRSRRRALALAGIGTGVVTIVLCIIAAVLTFTGALDDDESCFEAPSGVTVCAEGGRVT